MSELEAVLRAFHARRAGATSRVFARTGSYARLADTVFGARRILDLACGDAPMPGAIGIDLSHEELAHVVNAPAPIAPRDVGLSVRVQGRAQALPFADASFDACVCHLAFMLFDDIERVVAELGRVIAPGGTFAALLGGGPVEGAGERDAFHRFLAIGAPHFRAVRFGDPRAKSEAGWRDLFAGWSEPCFERIELELGGAFDDAWAFLGASYQLDPASADRVRDALRAELGERASCKVACWIATVRR